MNWYVKLFAPLIMATLTVVLFVTSRDLGIHRYYTDDIAGLGLGIITVWAAIQSLSFPQRVHKNRNRLALIVGVLLYAMFFLLISFGGSYMGKGASAIFFFVVSVSMGIAYYLRHKENTDSLAPEWMQMKTIAVLGALSGFAVIWFYLIDESMLRIINFEKVFPEEVAIGFLLVWGLSIGTAIALYYIEAILHHSRSKSPAWEAKLDQIGKDKDQDS